MDVALLAALAGIIGLLIGIPLLASLFSGTVSRGRVERFARREGLRITPDNGAAVITYLAITRRWRSLGLIVSLAVGLASTLGDQQVGIDLYATFGGWFAGAVVAEWVVARGERGQQRTASLVPRQVGDHLNPAARWAPVVLLGLAVLGAGTLWTMDLQGSPVSSVRVAVFLAGAVASVAVPALVGRHVLRRPRDGRLSGDLLAADDAIRHRALRVLAGSSIALLGLPLGGLVSVWILTNDTPDDAAAVGAVPVLVLMTFGWLVATKSRALLQPRSPERVPA